MTDHAFEQDLRAAFRASVDHEAPASLRASVIAIPDAVATTSEHRPIAHRQLLPRHRMVPIGLAAAAVIAAVAIGMSLIGESQQRVGDPSPVPDATQHAPARRASSVATGQMTAIREGHQAVLLADGRVLVVGGTTHVGGQDPLSAEIYDPADGTWTATAPTRAVGPTLTLLADGRVLATGGNERGFNRAPVAVAEVYDPESGTWSATGGMITPRSGHSATLLADGKILVAGSWGPDDVANAEASAELYDPESETWSATESMTQVRYGHTATLLADGRVFVAGGAPSNMTAELYDPVTATWRATDHMPQAHASHTATLLRDGRVLVVGGDRMGVPDRGMSTEESLRAAADLYDPTTGTWTAAGIMTEYRVYHAATLLPDGKLLVTGGLGGEDGRRATAEMYDPSTGTWRATRSMAGARARHTATLLPDGRVLLAGGEYGRGPFEEPMPTAELYDP